MFNFQYIWSSQNHVTSKDRTMNHLFVSIVVNPGWLGFALELRSPASVSLGLTEQSIWIVCILSSKAFLGDQLGDWITIWAFRHTSTDVIILPFASPSLSSFLVVTTSNVIPILIANLGSILRHCLLNQSVSILLGLGPLLLCYFFGRTFSSISLL